MTPREAPQQGWPEIDDHVHVWMRDQGCCTGIVEERIIDAPTGGNVVALSIKTDHPVGDHQLRISGIYDPEMQTSGSWHWPHDHQAPKPPSLNIEGLARLDLRPDEILAVTVGWSDLTVQQSQEYEEWLAEWFADHGQPVAGVMVLPQGSQLAAIRAPKPVAVNVDFSGTKWTSAQMDEFVREFTKRIQRQPPRQH